MFRGKRNEPPYGWLAYRGNLLVLCESFDPDQKIKDLIERTAYFEPGSRPGPGQQWTELDRLELRIFQRLDATRLDAEMERKFAQAEHSGLAGLAGLSERYRAIGGNGKLDERRAAATAFLEEMYTRYAKRWAERDKREEVSGRLKNTGLWLAFGVVVLGLVVALFRPVLGNALSALTEPVRQALIDYSAFLVVLFFGILGAYSSRLFRYSKDMQELRWREMDLVYSRGALAVRLMVGAIAAVILYFLMLGRILDGPLFLEGDFELWRAHTDGTLLVPLRPTENFARLVVWSILAGFFERFVPDRMKDVAKLATEEDKPNG